jgi:hypothetical protein
LKRLFVEYAQGKSVDAGPSLVKPTGKAAVTLALGLAALPETK